jgi:DNA-binding CsgD family transcriptional regulator
VYVQSPPRSTSRVADPARNPQRLPSRKPVRYQYPPGLSRLISLYDAGPAPYGLEVDRRPPPLVGREHELTTIDNLIGSAAAGRGRTLVLEGEAGIGKSRLTDVCAQRATAASMQVVRGGADELGVDAPGQLLTQIAVGLGSADRLRERGVAGTLGSNDTGFLVVESFVDVVEDALSSGPVMMIVEDVHWADRLSLRGIAAVVRRHAALPIGIVATLRPAPRSRASIALLEVCRANDAVETYLEGLAPEAVTELATAVLGVPPGLSLRERLDAAAGNPLYVTEVLDGLQERGLIRVEVGRAESASGELPADLARTLLRRIHALPPETVGLLRLASLMGAEFTFGDLATVAKFDVVDCAAAVQPAVDAAFVVGRDGLLRFRHDLVREAVYADIDPAIRRSLHVEAARSLVEAGASSQRIAEQFALGSPVGDLDAVEWLLRAADDAEQIDTSSAATLVERALSLAPPGWPRRGAVEARLVELLAWSGRVEESLELAGGVLDRSLTEDDEVAARRAYATVLGPLGYFEEGARQLERAADLSSGDQTEPMLRMSAAGMTLLSGGPASAATALAAGYAATAEPDVACWVRSTHGLAAICAGDYRDALDAFRSARHLLDEYHVPPLGFLIPHVWVGAALYHLDDFDGSHAALDAARRRAERRRDAGLLINAIAPGAGLHWFTGEWDESMVGIAAALGVADETGVHVEDVFLHATAALIEFDRGEFGRSDAHLESAESLVATGSVHLWGVDVMCWARALRLVTEGRADEAFDLLALVWDQTKSLHGLIQWRGIAPTLVRLASERRDVDLAQQVADDVEALAARTEVASSRATVLRCHGLLARDPDLLIEAAAAMRVSPRCVDTASICEEAAVLLIDRGRASEAVPLLEEASAVHRTTRATAVLRRLDGLMVATGARPRRLAAAPDHGWASLTAKEHQVVDLVAAGLSNPQIAERLYVSRRTVEAHITHIFRKLGLDNRTRLAAAAVARAG